MFAKALFTSALLALSTHAATDEDDKKYGPDWTTMMNAFEYDWTPYEVKTEDGYTLTVMNVTKKHKLFTKKRTPIVVQGIPGMPPDQQLYLYL